MKIVLARIIQNLIAMALTEKVVLWAVKLAAKKTENKIDDNVVQLLEAAYKNDVVALQEAVENLADLYDSRKPDAN